MENKREKEDRQILSEIVRNEKIVEHPTKGKIRLILPTLDIQRKIDSVARGKKKMLREATDQVTDPSTGATKTVPSFKSRQMLEREYQENGWWTKEEEDKLQSLTHSYAGYLTQLELLGYESQEDIFEGLSEAREKLIKLVGDEPSNELQEAVFRLSMVGGDPDVADKRLVLNAATSTEVDDIVGEIEVLRRQFDSYKELAVLYNEVSKLEQEKSALFSDSWQSQLEYYVRLAQLFYCSEVIETKQSVFTSIDSMEKEEETSLITWMFTELNAFWQGLSDEARERMNKYGFTQRLGTEKSSSEELPAQTQPLPDGDLPENPSMPLSEVTTTSDQ
jgi:hypothetical protein